MSSRKTKFRPTHRFGVWPVIDSYRAARWAVKEGVGVALFCAAVTAVMAVWSLFWPEIGKLLGINVLGLLDASVFLLIAVGINLNSRLAAIAGLALYILERALAIANTPPSAIVVILLLTMGFVNAVRGTFALHSGFPTDEGAALEYEPLLRSEVVERRKRLARGVRPVVILGCVFFVILFVPALSILVVLSAPAGPSVENSVALGFTLISVTILFLIIRSSVRTRLVQFGLVCPSCEEPLRGLRYTLKRRRCKNCGAVVIRAPVAPSLEPS